MESHTLSLTLNVTLKEDNQREAINTTLGMVEWVRKNYPAATIEVVKVTRRNGRPFRGRWSEDSPNMSKYPMLTWRARLWRVLRIG